MRGYAKEFAPLLGYIPHKFLFFPDGDLTEFDSNTIEFKWLD